jgi:hypothetical protein
MSATTAAPIRALDVATPTTDRVVAVVFDHPVAVVLDAALASNHRAAMPDTARSVDAEAVVTITLPKLASTEMTERVEDDLMLVIDGRNSRHVSLGASHTWVIRILLRPKDLDLCSRGNLKHVTS